MRNAAISVVCVLVVALSAAAGQRGSGGNQTTGQFAIRGRLLFPTPQPPEDRIEVVLERSMQRIATVFTDSIGQFAFLGLGGADYQVVVRLADYEDVNQ